MRRTLCDGCWKAGIHNDLTDLPPDKKRRVPVTRALYLDLCVERCVPIYDKFDIEKERVLAAHSEQFKIRIKALMDNFWKEVTGGAEEERN